jgi:hypothetical protein
MTAALIQEIARFISAPSRAKIATAVVLMKAGSDREFRRLLFLDRVEHSDDADPRAFRGIYRRNRSVAHDDGVHRPDPEATVTHTAGQSVAQ